MKTFDNKKLFIFTLAIISLGFVYGDFISGLDYDFDNLLSSIRTPAGTTIFGYLTLLGDKYFLGVLSILLSLFIYKYWSKDTFLLKVFWAAFIMNTLSGLVIKYMVGRDRPLGAEVLEGYTYSFPSGHATTAFFLYGFIAIILFNMRDIGKKKRYAATAFFVSLFLLVGFSRLYLGVHFLSDVLGGYIIGWFWLNFLISFFNEISRDQASSVVKVVS
ncbi:MAG TPA: phosphatase PAP2 family protein [Candidatus Paceibacterota bacterium]|nr:phosphatase PAP2 family protein [Candidatus Paceibacterota bacterium]